MSSGTGEWQSRLASTVGYFDILECKVLQLSHCIADSSIRIANRLVAHPVASYCQDEARDALNEHLRVCGFHSDVTAEDRVDLVQMVTVEEVSAEPIQLYLKTLFILFLPLLIRGGPREGPDVVIQRPAF